MLKDKELGKAIEKAIELKIASGKVASKKAIAIVFGVKPPSMYDWIKKGSISKDKLPKLFEYFADVVGPEHWGLAKQFASYAGDFIEAEFTEVEDRPSGALPPPQAAAEEKPALSPRHAALIGLFDGLPESEQKEVMALLEKKKQYFDQIYVEMSAKKEAKAK